MIKVTRNTYLTNTHGVSVSSEEVLTYDADRATVIDGGILHLYKDGDVSAVAIYAHGDWAKAVKVAE